MPNLPRGNATLLQNGLASSGFLRVSDHTALDIHACPFRACENTLGQKLNEFYLNQEKKLLLFALWRRRPILLCELLAPFLQMTKLLPMPKLVCIALSLHIRVKMVPESCNVMFECYAQILNR